MLGISLNGPTPINHYEVQEFCRKNNIGLVLGSYVDPEEIIRYRTNNIQFVSYADIHDINAIQHELVARGCVCVVLRQNSFQTPYDIDKYISELDKIQGLGNIYMYLPAAVESSELSAIVSRLDPYVYCFIPDVGSATEMKALYEQFPKVRALIYPCFNVTKVPSIYSSYYRNFLMSYYDILENPEAFQEFIYQYKREQLSMVSYATNTQGMIINPLPVSQFQPGQSEFECGAYCVAILGRSTAPAVKNSFSAPNLIKYAEDQYARLTGSNGSTNIVGLSYSGVRNILSDSGLHYWDIGDYDPASSIKAAISHGYPVIVSVPESGVVDLDLGRNPYWWGATGTHYVIVVGNHPDGNFMVIDPANVEKGDGNLQTPKNPLPWPRHYSFRQIDWGCIIQMPWLPSIPNNNPLSWPPYEPADKLPIVDMRMMYDPNVKEILYVANNQVVKRENVVA